MLALEGNFFLLRFLLPAAFGFSCSGALGGSGTEEQETGWEPGLRSGSAGSRGILEPASPRHSPLQARRPGNRRLGSAPAARPYTTQEMAFSFLSPLSSS